VTVTISGTPHQGTGTTVSVLLMREGTQ
jgi:hypothetical protein